MKLTAKKFLLISAALLVAGLGSYIYLVDRWSFPKRPLPELYIYSQYLLESSADIHGKVIIESGSNSQHAIAPSVLAEYFKGPVITVAHNAGYPLAPKVSNLAAYLKPGDVVILPLEWIHYGRDDKLPTDYLKLISAPSSRESYYYNNMPVWERLRFLLRQFPLKNAIASLREPPADFETLARQQLSQLSHYEGLIRSGNRSAFGNSDKKSPKHGQVASDPRTGMAKLQSCDNYLFGPRLRREFNITTDFRRALAGLEKLARQDVTIYFTWPAVVDYASSRCYQDEELMRKVNAYASQVRVLVEQQGFNFIGDFRDSHFPSRCFSNTYYHITEECAQLRSERLVKQLHKAGASPTNSDTSPGQLLKIADQRLQQTRTDLIARMEKRLPPARAVHTNRMGTHLLLSRGWSLPEKSGAWSMGSTSTLSMKIPPKFRHEHALTLDIRGNYFNGEELTGVIVNGHDLGGHVLTSARFELPMESLDDDILRLQLNHSNPVSPHALGKSDDKRKLKYKLLRLSIAPTEATGS